MTTEPNTGGAAPAVTNPAPNPDPAPAAAAPAAPVAETVTNPTPTVQDAPPATAGAPAAQPESAPAAEGAPAEPAKAVTTILGAEPPKETQKPAEGAQPQVEPKKEESSQSADPAPLPTYEKFTLPEGIQMDEKKLGEFTKDLGEFETSTKAEHAKVQEFAQKLVNRYVTETQDTAKRLGDYYTNTWEKQKNDWREAFIKDPDIGGNRQETTAKTVQKFVGDFGGTPEQTAELRKFMETGIGNNPVLIRLMNNAATALNSAQATIEAMKLKYETETNAPLPGRTPESTKKSRTQTLYGKSSAAS